MDPKIPEQPGAFLLAMSNEDRERIADLTRATNRLAAVIERYIPIADRTADLTEMLVQKASPS